MIAYVSELGTPWLEEFALEGLRAIEVYLAKHAELVRRYGA